MRLLRTFSAKASWIVTVYLVLFLGRTCYAQTQFLPEVDAFVGDSKVRFSFQAKETRENGDPTQAEIGPSIDFYFRPLQNLVSNHVDKSKTRFFLLSFGYRYLPSAGAPTTNRILMVATPRFPVKSKVVISDRNRGELNFSKGDLNWRYRNRLQVEREVTIHAYHPTPYTNVEVYYDSKQHKWSSTAVEAGCQFPLGRHTEIDLYYEHQNNTGTAPNMQINGIGLVLNLHFYGTAE